MASSTDPGQLRVCILAKANPFIWVHHYVNAFRRHSDVITAGPCITADDLEHMGRGHLAHLVRPNDIDMELENIGALLPRLPENWRPDLVVSIQSGMAPVEQIDWLSCPTAHISVDSWHDFAELVHARPFDFVFSAQREFVDHFRATGNRNVHWLPLACDPNVHRPVQVEKQFDITFVGSVERSVHASRTRRLNRLAENFSVAAANGLDSESMCVAYGRGALAFNSSIAQDVNMRVFEVLAMGVPLLTNRDADVNGLLDLFVDGEHLITYDDETLIECARKYIEDHAARERLAARGREVAMRHHTYNHRVQQLIETISAQVDWEQSRQRPLLRSRGALLDYLPTAPGRVADFEMTTRLTKYAARRAGGETLTALLHDATNASPRRNSYDELADIGKAHGEAFDTVLVQSTNEISVTDRALRQIHAVLRPGGTMIAGLSAQDVGQFGQASEDVWHALERLGFAVSRLELVADGGNGPAMYVCARKTSRGLRDVAREIYTRNPAPGLSLDAILSRLP